HIESCPVCRDRRKRKVSTNRLMQVLPVAAIPSDLRMAVLSLAEAPDQHEHRVRIAQRAEPFDVWGWPTSLERRASAARKEGRGDGATSHLVPVIAVAACVALVIGAIFLLTGGGPDGSKNTNNKVPGGIAAGPSDSPSDGLPSPSDSVEPSPTKTTHSPSPTPTKHTPAPAPTTHRPAPPPPPTHKPSPKPPAPKLSAVGCDMDLGNSCTITLSASGGTVQWSLADSGGLTIDPANGSVPKNGTKKVTATRPSGLCPSTSTTVSFSPSASATVQWTCPIIGG
ncbi:MAG TPA: hypothetical protein VGD53_02095, partial [Actinoallomurus sp.]